MYIKQITDIQEQQKKTGVTTQGRKEVEVGTLLLGNDKNNVIANYLLNYLLCLSFRD